ncbi:hypothetical protein [Aquipseudomonas alcaligenes]|nr:hypothetical protein [Pseudomonas alcaligenes]
MQQGLIATSLPPLEQSRNDQLLSRMLTFFAYCGLTIGLYSGIK